MAKDFREGFSSALSSAKDLGEKATKAAITQSLRYAKASPEESKNTIIGAGVGAGIGFAIGGSIGVVGFFGGIGIPWVVLLLLSGGFLGNRLGISKDKAELDRKRRDQGARLENLEVFLSSFLAKKRPKRWFATGQNAIIQSQNMVLWVRLDSAS